MLIATAHTARVGMGFKTPIYHKTGDVVELWASKDWGDQRPRSH